MRSGLFLLCTRAWRKLPVHERRVTLSTGVTLSRIFLAPVIVGTMIAGYWTVSFILFVCAALTDVLDGALARALQQQTMLGACLDPVADKILLLSCFATLAFVKTPLFTIPRWFVGTVLIKELILIGGTIILYVCKGQLYIAPTRLGKVATFLQICFIGWLFACYFFSWMPSKTYSLALILLFCMITATLVQYGRIGVRVWRSS